MDYPNELHDLHNDFPFAIENIVPPKESDKKLCKKLIPNLMNKRKYVCHYRILKQCLENGLKLGTVHRLLQFEQESFIRPYIELNTKYRQAAQSDFERDFYKLLNNVIFGKSMENVLKRVSIKLVKKENNKLTRELNVETLTASPLFKSFEIIVKD